MFICKPSTDSVLSYCFPLECTASVSFPSWTRILSRNPCQCSGWVCSKANTLPHLCWCTTHHLPAQALAPTCPHSCGSLGEGYPRAPGLGFAHTQEEKHPWGYILLMTYRCHALRGLFGSVIITISRDPYGTDSNVLSMELCLNSILTHPGEGNGNPLQYSCLESSMVGYSPWGHKESDTTEWLHLHVLSCTISFLLGVLSKKPSSREALS